MTTGYLTVVGRTSDVIIRGGKNISAPAVEAEVATHPGVAMVAAVAMPDDVFGEKVCVYVEVRRGWEITDPRRPHRPPGVARCHQGVVPGAARSWSTPFPGRRGARSPRRALRDDARHRHGP